MFNPVSKLLHHSLTSRISGVGSIIVTQKSQKYNRFEKCIEQFKEVAATRRKGKSVSNSKREYEIAGISCFSRSNTSGRQIILNCYHDELTTSKC